MSLKELAVIGVVSLSGALLIAHLQGWDTCGIVARAMSWC